MRNLKVYILVVLSFFAIQSFAQKNRIKVMVGKTDKMVRHYVDSLFKLRPNPMYKIEENTTEKGNLILTADFILDDEDFYQCVITLFIFQRANGNEICISHSIAGLKEHAQVYLSWVKDNFTEVKMGEWEKSINDNVKCVAKYKKDGVDGGFIFTFELEGK